MAGEKAVWVEDLRARVETELQEEGVDERVITNILQPLEAGSFDPDERADGDCDHDDCVPAREVHQMIDEHARRTERMAARLVEAAANGGDD